MLKSIFSSAALILIIFMGNINAATYYVDNVIGNDGNTGLSTSTPWKTFAKVCNTSLASGSIVSFKCGERFPATTSFNKSNITVNSYGTGARPVIDGGGNIVPTNGVVPFELTGTNINLTGIKIVNGYPCNIGLGASYVTIESCNIDSNAYIDRSIYNGNPGCMYSDEGAQHVILRNSTISHNRGGSGWYITGASDVLLEYDTIVDNSQNGLRIGYGVATAGTPNLTVRYCVVMVIEDDGAVNSNFYYNVILSDPGVYATEDGTGGLYMHDGGGGVAPHNNNWYNNTFINTIPNGHYKFSLWVQPTSGMTNITFKNNIFYATGDDQYLQYWQHDVGDGVITNSWTFSNNLYYFSGTTSHPFVRSGVTAPTGTWSSLSTWKSATGWEANSPGTNPLFTNFSSGDYTLQSGSPAINAGVNVSLTTDINGNSVPSSYPDMGAYQHGSGGGGGGILPTLTLNLTVLIEALYTADGTAMPVSPWVTVELHNSTTPYALVDSNSAALSPTGAGTFTFTKAVNGTNYYIVVKSMNTLATWSSTPHSFNSSALSYNFTTAVTQAYTDGSNPPLVLHGGKYCIYSGDINKDGLVNKTDFTLIDKDNSTFNYHPVNDLNGDGLISSADEQFIDNNFIISIHRQVPAGAQ